MYRAAWRRNRWGDIDFRVSGKHHFLPRKSDRDGWGDVADGCSQLFARQSGWLSRRNPNETKDVAADEPLSREFHGRHVNTSRCTPVKLRGTSVPIGQPRASVSM